MRAAFLLGFSAGGDKIVSQMRVISILCPLFCALAAQAQTNFIPVSNLNQPTAEHNGVWNTESLAAPFTTGNTAASLSVVSVSLASANGSGGHFNLSLYSDAGGSPGSSLAALSGNDSPTSAGTYTYTNTSPLVLSADTTYWIVASSPDATGATAFQWNLTFSAALDAGSMWTTGGGKYNSGGGWNSSGGGVYQQFSVTVANPVPPALAIFQPVALTFPATGFPFVLQQNSDLATTNWVNATNAIQIASVNTNQIVFLVPPNGGQMFYRLNLQ
jgi:hypothetical protein